MRRRALRGRDTVGGIRVDEWAALVEGDFDAAVFQIGETVWPAWIAEVDPHRHGRRSEIAAHVQEARNALQLQLLEDRAQEARR